MGVDPIFDNRDTCDTFVDGARERSVGVADACRRTLTAAPELEMFSTRGKE